MINQIGGMLSSLTVDWTHIRPETCKASHESFVGPLVDTLELWIHAAPALTRREEVLQCFNDERSVAIDLLSNS